MDIFAVRCERAGTYCEGCARKVDVRPLEYGTVAGFQDEMSHDSHMTLKEQWYQLGTLLTFGKGFLLCRSPNCE